MTPSRIRGTGPLGSTVVLAFLLGLLSGPLRTCVSHQAHVHATFAPLSDAHSASSSGHEGHGTSQRSPASDEQGEGAGQVGCECLGLCQLESSPPLLVDGAQAIAVLPWSAEPSGIDEDIEPVQGSPHAIPLARGPPALV